jgi:hypothetical protein
VRNPDISLTFSEGEVSQRIRMLKTPTKEQRGAILSGASIVVGDRPPELFCLQIASMRRADMHGSSTVERREN